MPQFRFNAEKFLKVNCAICCMGDESDNGEEIKDETHELEDLEEEELDEDDDDEEFGSDDSNSNDK